MGGGGVMVRGRTAEAGEFTLKPSKVTTLFYS